MRDAAGPRLRAGEGGAARRCASALSHRAQRGDRASCPPLRAASAAPATLAARRQTPLSASGPRGARTAAAAARGRSAGRPGGTGWRGALRGAAVPAGGGGRAAGRIGPVRVSVGALCRSALCTRTVRRTAGRGLRLSPRSPAVRPAPGPASLPVPRHRGDARGSPVANGGPAPPAASLTFAPVRRARGPGFARQSGQAAASLRVPARCCPEAAPTAALAFLNLPGCAHTRPVTCCAVPLPASALAFFHLCSRITGMEASLQRG